MLTSIRIPPSTIDEVAEKNRIQGNLSHLESNLQVKTQFKKGYRDHFNMFDSRERIEVILAVLEQEIDFENYMKQGVILEHFPLHKR